MQHGRKRQLVLKAPKLSTNLLLALVQPAFDYMLQIARPCAYLPDPNANVWSPEESHGLVTRFLEEVPRDVNAGVSGS